MYPGPGVPPQGSYRLCWRGTGFPGSLCFTLPGGCLHLLSASCVLAAWELSPSPVCGATFSSLHRGPPGATAQFPQGFPSAPTAACPQVPLDAGRPPGAGAWTSSFLPPRCSAKGPSMPAAPALSPHAPADKLQALGPCLGSDSGWGVEATLEPSLAGSRDHVRVPIVTGLTALHGSWGKKGLRSLAFLSLLPMDLPSSGRCVRDGAWAWAQ